MRAATPAEEEALLEGKEGIMRDLSKSPMPIPNAPTEVKDGNNTVEAGTMQPGAATANGHQDPS